MEAEQAGRGLLDTARAYVRGGLSVIAVKGDGSKAPELSSWKPYQNDRPTDDELCGWFSRPGARGIAILGGPVSAGLEVLDFDCAEAWDTWRPLSLQLLAALGERVPTLPVVETPSGGRHLYYRHYGDQEGNQKLCVYVRGGTRQTGIETRGKGGYVLAPGSAAVCHPARRPYRLLQGNLGDVPVISPDVRAVLLDSARSLSEEPLATEAHAPRTRLPGGDRPGDLYISRADWRGLLGRHGWTLVAQRGETAYWRRPGKTRGSISATTNHAGAGYLIVFSTNAPPFETGRGYSLFGAYGLLEHGGDYDAAARALKDKGYTTVPAPRVADPARERRSTRSLDDLLRVRLGGAVPRW